MKCLLTCLVVGVLALAALAAQDKAAMLREADADMQAAKYSDAAKKYAQANKQAGNKCTECLLGSSLAFLRMGHAEAALDEAKRALKTAPNDPVRAQVHIMMGNAHMQLGQESAKHYKDAEQEFRAAMNADPQLATAHLKLGMAMLRQSRDAEGVEELKKFLAADPSDPSAAMVHDWINHPADARLRYAAPFTVHTSTGEQLSLQGLAGKLVLLDFWATWNGRSRESLPGLRDLVQQYPQVVVLSISVDKHQEDWREFIKKHDMTWPQAWDPDQKLVELYRVNELPTYVLIDRRGVIRSYISGLEPRATVAQRLAAELDKLVNQPTQ